MAGGSIVAADLALDNGLSVHIGGGFHHAFSDHGEGFCLLNDIAIALGNILGEGRIKRAMVVDCDVHQGNGTASIFANCKDVFTFSIHQMDLYPAEKSRSSLDIGLWSGDGDDKYIRALKDSFPRLYEEFQPEVIFYVAGADPYEKDQLGGLRLTFDGLEERDRIVIESARKLQIPVLLLLAGGYALDVASTVKVHVNTIRTAMKIQKKYPS